MDGDEPLSPQIVSPEMSGRSSLSIRVPAVLGRMSSLARKVEQEFLRRIGSLMRTFLQEAFGGRDIRVSRLHDHSGNAIWEQRNRVRLIGLYLLRRINDPADEEVAQRDRFRRRPSWLGFD
jgi:hypothetical protein